MSEIRNIIEDVKSGALPAEELPDFIFFVARPWLIVIGVVAVLICAALLLK